MKMLVKILPYLALLLTQHLSNAQTPNQSYWITPDSLNLDYTENTIVTADKARLLSWNIRGEKSNYTNTTIIIAYATTGNMGNLLHYALAFSQAGYNVQLFDYRGLGKSSDFITNKSLLYNTEHTTDLLSVVKHVRKNEPNSKIGILGFSLGTLISVLATQNEHADFIIGDGFISDPNEIVTFWKKNANIDYQLPIDSHLYTEALDKINCPMLLISGSEDPITKTEGSLSTIRRRENRELIVYKGDHLEATKIWYEKNFGDGYVKRIKIFLDKYLAK